MTTDELTAKAEALAGRPVEVEQTTDGMYVVTWFAYGESPPPKAATVEEALQGFIDKMLTRKINPAILAEEVTLTNQGETHG